MKEGIKMKKKIISTLLALTLSSSMLCSTASAVTMYAPDGRTASVADADVEAWKAVGWYDKNYIIMYAPGRKTARVSLQNINAWKKVGWYEQPTITEYYSCNKLVPKYDNIVHTDFLGKFEKENVIIYRYKYTSVTDYEAYFCHMINDGWKVQTTNIDNETLDAYMTKGSSKIGIHVIIKYEEVWISLINSTSTVTMYAPDGRTSEVAKTDVDAWKKVGWYEVPVTTVYARDGRTEVIAKSDVEAWKKVGWYDTESITMYAPDGRTKEVPIHEIETRKKVGWYEVPVTRMYSSSGKTEIVAKSDVGAWKKQGWSIQKPTSSYSNSTNSTNSTSSYSAPSSSSESLSEILSEILCHSCKGTGFSPISCFHCNGSGRIQGEIITSTVSGILPFGARKTYTCPECDGVGKQLCYSCKGTGKRLR